MTKQSLPNKPTYFLNFNKESIEPLIDTIISKYEIDDEELEYLKTVAITYNADRILFWRPELSQFNYVEAHGGFLNYNWLNHDQPEVMVLRHGSNELEFVYTDKINTDIFYEFDSAHNNFGKVVIR